MSVLSLSETSDAPSEVFLEKLRGVMKDRPCISLLGRIDFDQVTRNETADSVPPDAPEPSLMASVYAPDGIKVPRAAEMTAYLFVPTDIPERIVDHFREIYYATIVPKFGARYATVWYWWQILCVVLYPVARRLRKLLMWGGALLSLKKVLDWVSSLFGP